MGDRCHAADRCPGGALHGGAPPTARSSQQCLYTCKVCTLCTKHWFTLRMGRSRALHTMSPGVTRGAASDKEKMRGGAHKRGQPHKREWAHKRGQPHKREWAHKRGSRMKVEEMVVLVRRTRGKHWHGARRRGGAKQKDCRSLTGRGRRTRAAHPPSRARRGRARPRSRSRERCRCMPACHRRPPCGHCSPRT